MNVLTFRKPFIEYLGWFQVLSTINKVVLTSLGVLHVVFFDYQLCGVGTNWFIIYFSIAPRKLRGQILTQ